ncbi:hypothetical protein BaRGS_00005425 [Batillaria attramentaria]|uniref:Uncharacterized protein n=1 Tax=Batillaria attramentaria TaxID=370345 RepID=A0ABD0LV87_9CAEN
MGFSLLPIHSPPTTTAARARHKRKGCVRDKDQSEAASVSHDPEAAEGCARRTPDAEAWPGQIEGQIF